MNGDAIQKFFVQHIEKIVLAGICAFAIFLIYQGLGFEMYRDKLQPNALKERAEMVRNSIDDDHTEAVLKRLPEDDSRPYEERIQQLQNKIPFNQYPHALLEPKSIDESIKRADVKLSNPVELQAVGVLATMATKAYRRTEYQLMNFENAEEPEEEEEKPRSNRRRRNRRGRNDGGEMMPGSGMGMEGSFGMGMDGSGSGAGDDDDEMGSPMGSPMGMGMGMGEGGAFGGYGAAGGGTRRLKPKYNLGAEAPPNRTQAGMGMGEEEDDDSDRGRKMPLNTVPETAYLIAGTAALPHEEMVEAFQAAYEKTSDYKPRRDRPVYLGYEVQRADVTEKAVDELTDEDWATVSDWDTINTYALKWWNGYALDVVPGDYREQTLTSLIPPILIKDYSQFATHPKVPMKTMQQLKLESDNPLDRIRTFDPFGNAEEGEDETNNENDGAAAMGGFAGSGGSEMGSGGGMMAPGGGMMPGGSAMGDGGMMGPGMAGGIETDPPEFKLVRFYDFWNPRRKDSPVPGRKYVYRMRVKLEDPNFPRNPALSPSLRSLTPEVFQRVLAKVKAFEETEERDFVIYTPWSEPCKPISLPTITELYTGPIEEPIDSRIVEIEDHEVEFEKDVPVVNMVGTRWFLNLHVPVPVPFEAKPGTVLDKRLEAEVVDPLTLTIKAMPETMVRTGGVVLDVDGGKALQLKDDPDSDEELYSPAMVLVFDPMNGGLDVREETADRFQYSRYTYTENLPPESEPQGGDESGYMGGFGMEDGGMGGFGMDGGGDFGGSEMGSGGGRGGGRGGRGR